MSYLLRTSAFEMSEEKSPFVGLGCIWVLVSSCSMGILTVRVDTRRGGEFPLLDPGIQSGPAYSEKLCGFGNGEMCLAFERLPSGGGFDASLAGLSTGSLLSHLVRVPAGIRAVLPLQIVRRKRAAAAGACSRDWVHKFYNFSAVMRSGTSVMRFYLSNWVQVCKSM